MNEDLRRERSSKVFFLILKLKLPFSLLAYPVGIFFMENLFPMPEVDQDP